ncbi:MAG: two-component sensor histidine kinase [Lachnospiraceae bacterium]|nr:two-component sensor histidine kinase [Lachnospiraceae bacterium]
MMVGLLSVGVTRNSILLDGSRVSLDNRSSELISRLRILSDRISGGAYSDEDKKNIFLSDAAMLSDVYDSRVIITDRALKIIYDSYGNSTGRRLMSSAALRSFKDKAEIRNKEKDGYVTMAVPVRMYDAEGEIYCGGVVYAMLSAESVYKIENEKAGRSLIILLLFMGVLTAVAVVLSLLFGRPLKNVAVQIRQAADFDGGDVSEVGYTETRDIAGAFNSMKNRMKALDDSRQEFVANVSHELKTPMASIKVLADSINMQPDAPLEMYQDFMQDISKEIDREDRIISDLLSLVHMEKGASALDIKETDINLMLEDMIKRLGPLAKKNDVALIFESIRQVNADVDEIKLSSAFTNLIENGIKYNKRPGMVKVRLDADYREFTLVVSDTGIGIPEEEIRHIFERFYRVDKSHSREIGGTGLGLSIARRTIVLHRGQINVESEPGKGTEFTVKIPLVYNAEVQVKTPKGKNGKKKTKKY